MAPAARTADSLWTRLGQAAAEAGPVAWFNDNVLHHAAIGRTSGAVRGAWARVLDVCYPLIVLLRGARRGVGLLRAWWKGSSPERRRLKGAAFLICLVALALIHYGPYLIALGLVAGCAWLGRDTSRKGVDPETPAHISKLQAVYNGLVPYLQNADDPDQHFKPGGRYRDAFTAWSFDEQDRLTRLAFDYSEYFRDGEAESRARVERALEGKIGQSNEYLYEWDEEGNHLEVAILPPLPTGIGAQAWPVADIEFVLGVTDPDSAGRTIPVLVADPGATEDTLTPLSAAAQAGLGGVSVPPGFQLRQLPPVILRAGTSGPSAHLLISGGPGTGKSTALRGLIGQALARGQQVAVSDSDPVAEYGALAGMPGVLRCAEQPGDSLALLEWAGLELERRAQQPGEPPLWIFIDELPELCEAAARIGGPDPQDAVAALARKARFARATLVVTARADRVATLRPAVRGQLTSRIGLGRLSADVSTLLFGGTLELGGGQALGPGRGYVRLGGSGPVIRLQTPYAPTLALSSA